MAMRALVLDDEEDVRRLLNLMLNRLGFETMEGANGQVGLDLLRKAPPVNVILLDWCMPVMDGPAFLKVLQKDSALKTIPVMMLTGMNEIDDVATALTLGAQEYLMKPITQKTLKEKLNLLDLLR